MAHSLVAQWIAAAMLQFAGVNAGATPDAVEDSKLRYASIAYDMVEIAFDPFEKPLFKGGDARAKTALLMASTAWVESGYRADVDEGRCRATECDHGRAFGFLQVHPKMGMRLTDDGGFAYDRTGFHGRDLIRDRGLMFRTGLHMLRVSLERCGDLSAYVAGICRQSGEPNGGMRMRLAVGYARRNPVPVADVDAMDTEDCAAYAIGASADVLSD